MSGTVLLIAGPSGSGKTSLTRALVNRVPFLTRAITVTTRLPRPGEVSGEDYHFVSPERFAALKRSDALVECAETYTESYGIHVPSWPDCAIELSFSQAAVPSLSDSGFQTPSASLCSPHRQPPRRSGFLIGTAQTVSIESLVTSRKLLFRRSLTGCF